jgi:chromosome segregation ATPase
LATALLTCSVPELASEAIPAEKTAAEPSSESAQAPSAPEHGAVVENNAVVLQEEKKIEDVLPPKNKADESKTEDPQSATEEDLQRAEILRLQQQLSEALQKVVFITQEQIRDKDVFLKVSTDLSQLKSEISDSQREVHDYKQKLKGTEATKKKSKDKIEKLEDAVERSLDEQDRLMDRLDKAEDDYEKLVIEAKDLEAKLDDSEGGSGDTEKLRDELKETKKSLVDKDREIEAQKHRIEHLEKDLKDTAAVNKIQVDELEGEKKALEGKLKGERLAAQSKMTKKDDTMGTLQKELSEYKNNVDIQDMALVKAGLESAQTELDMARSDVERSERMVGKLKGEKEDMLERNSALNEQIKVLHRNVQELSAKTKDLGDKVLQWTEKTYEWKTRAEKAEKQVQQADETYMSDSGDEALVDEAPQGMFLQSVMDKKANAKIKSRWNLFSRDGAEGEDTSGEAIRIKTLEERNIALEAAISELRIEVVKMKTAHRGELHSSQKMVAQLQGENDALVLKNSTLLLLSDRD